MERLAQELHKGGSPSSQMLMEVGAKAMETSHLVELLDELHLEDVLSLLVEFGESWLTAQVTRLTVQVTRLTVLVTRLTVLVTRLTVQVTRLTV